VENPSNEKVIFLDIDGVICHLKYKPTWTGGVIEDFDPRCVSRIVKAIKEIGAKVVIHSTWVFTDKPEEIKKRFKDAGFPIVYLHNDWLCNYSKNKNEAIKKWLDIHMDTKTYVVVDDDTIGTHPQVKVVDGIFQRGFQDKHLAELVKAFGIDWKQDKLYKEDN
jgi:hypothetical protein